MRTMRLISLTMLLLLGVAVALPAAVAAGSATASGPGGGSTARSAAAPTITSLSRKHGKVGRSVVVSGAHFGRRQGDRFVLFGVATARVTSWSAKRIGVRVPAGLTPGRYPVRVGDPSVKSNAVAFTVTSPTGGDARLLGTWTATPAGRSETFTFKSSGAFSFVVSSGDQAITTTGSFWASKGSLLLFKRKVDGKAAANVILEYSIPSAGTLVVGTESFSKK